MHVAQHQLHAVDAGVVVIRDVFVVALDDIQCVDILHCGSLDALDGRIGAGQLRQRRQAHAFDQIQIRSVFGEIRLGSRLHAAGVEPQTDGVQVGLDDLLLRQIALDDHRVVRLDDLTVHGADALYIRQIQVSGQLLRNGGRTGDLRVVLQGVADGADDTDDVESVVFPERLVFDGDEGVDHVLRDILVLQVGAQRIAGIQIVQHVSVRIEHRGILGEQVVQVVRIDLRRFLDDAHHVISRYACRDDAKAKQRKQDAENDLPCLLLFLLLFRLFFLRNLLFRLFRFLLYRLLRRSAAFFISGRTSY